MSVISNDLGKRIQWIDVLRGYGMILIALGHAVLGLMSANLIDANSVGRDVVIFIYLFHMPIIFFVSGLVSSDAAKSMRSFVYSVGMWIALPYVVWSIILVLVQNALPGANSPIPFGDLAYMLWAPVSIFWFLHSLFVIKVADYATVKIIKSPFVAVALLAMAGVAGFSIWGIKTFACLYFYCLGRICKERVFYNMTARINGSFVLAVSICAVCIAFLLAMTNYYGIQPPERLSPLFEPQRWFIITGTIGVFLFVVVSVLSSDYAISRTIKTVGIYSMVIYVQHTIWGSGIRSLLVKTGLNDITALVFLILFGSLLLPIAWQKISDRLGITRYFGIRPAE